MRANSRWRRRAVAALIVATLVPAGCGLPSESGVVVQGRGEAAGVAAGEEGISAPAGRGGTTDPEEFVANFLAAAAGLPERAADRVREFLPPDTWAEWQPGPAVNIVRLNRDPLLTPVGSAGGRKVELQVTHLGELTARGIVLPQPAKSRTYTFSIGEIERHTGLFVADPPPVILLSDTALNEFYEARTIYFWSLDGKTLVPDLRYLPRRDWPISQWPTEIIQWVLDGPSPWLEPAVQPLPDEAQRVGNVPTGERREVTLSKAADPTKADEVDRLAAQLRWSMRGIQPGPDPALDLKIDQTKQTYSDERYLAANLAYRGARKAMQFCVYQGQVRHFGPLPEGSTVVSALPDAANSGVLAAAMANDRETNRTVAAFVRSSGSRVVLDVGPTTAPLRRTELRARNIGQPVWLSADGPAIGLVVADGVLKRFTANSNQVDTVGGGLPDRLTAMAAAPDGRRLAYIAGDRLYVAPLVREDAAVTVGQPQEVPTGLTGLAGVAWSQEGWLVVAGKNADGLTSIFDLTVDGALRVNRTDDDLGAATITHLVALTDDPSDTSAAGQVMLVANGQAYSLFSELTHITAAEVLGTSTPPPTTGSRAPTPTAPFFLD